jgi:hypothetical protein
MNGKNVCTVNSNLSLHLQPSQLVMNINDRMAYVHIEYNLYLIPDHHT